MVKAPNVRFQLAHEPNPVLVKELRARFRGPRAFAALTSFLLLLTFFAWFAYAQAAQSYNSYGGMGMNQAGAGPQIGKSILLLVSFVEALFLAFIAPSLTADCISGEVERQTWDLLRATPLSGWSILLGKVGAAFGYVLLLAFSALPVMSLAFIFGGASLTAVLQMQGSMLATGVLYLAVGAFWSSFIKRTGRAAVLSYGSVGLLLLFPIVLPVLSQAFGFWSNNYISWYQGSLWWVTSMTLSPPIEVFTILAQGSSYLQQASWTWAAIIVGRLLLATALLLVAGGRIRPIGPRGLLAFLMVAGLMALWLGVIVAGHPMQTGIP